MDRIWLASRLACWVLIFSVMLWLEIVAVVLGPACVDCWNRDMSQSLIPELKGMGRQLSGTLLGRNIWHGLGVMFCPERRFGSTSKAASTQLARSI